MKNKGVRMIFLLEENLDVISVRVLLAMIIAWGYVDPFSLPGSEEAPWCHLARPPPGRMGQMVSGLLQVARTGLASSYASVVQMAVMAMAEDLVGSAVFGRLLQPCRLLACSPRCFCTGMGN